MNGRKARAIRKKHGVKHARLARVRVVHEREKSKRAYWDGPKLSWGREKPNAGARHNSRKRRRLGLVRKRVG